MAQRTYRYFDFVMAAFVTVLLCSNVIGASKVCTVNIPIYGELTFGAAVLFFPISYLFGDILTEVYGYARSRRVVWAGFAAMIFASFMSWFVLWLPAAPFWQNQAAFEAAFGATWRITGASLIAYCVGEFLNSFTLAKMKIWTKGKKLWARTIGSTIIGEAVDTVIFYPLAFAGTWDNATLAAVMMSSYMIKVGWEAAMTPFTYQIVGFLKRAEKEDFYDRDTDFNPFSLRT